MNIALVLAAGSGTRMNSLNKPKQFVLIKDKPLMMYSIESFNHHPEIDAIVIVTSKDYVKYVQDLCQKHQLNKVKAVVIGGQTRQQSVFNGLKEIEKIISSEKDIVLIHDSARPLVNDKIISNNILLCKKYGAVDTVIPASDTIINSKDGEIIEGIPNRQELYQSQTPQTFVFNIIKDAHLKALETMIPHVTDDCRLVKHFGIDVHLAEGSKQNFKITTDEDLELFKALVK